LFPVVGGALKLNNEDRKLIMERKTNLYQDVFQELYILFENKIIEAVYCHVISFN